MRWTVFVIAAAIAVGLDTSPLLGLLTIPSLGRLSPTLVGVLVVFIALFAPRATALWSAWILGLLMDLCPPDVLVLPGPHALGYVFGTFIILQMRTVVLRRRVLTLVVLTAVCLFAAGLVVVALGTVRSWYPRTPAPWSDYRPFIELLRSTGNALYTGLLAVPVGWLLLKSMDVWGFQQSPDRRRAV